MKRSEVGVEKFGEREGRIGESESLKGPQLSAKLWVDGVDGEGRSDGGCGRSGIAWLMKAR